MLQNDQSKRNIRSFRVGREAAGGLICRAYDGRLANVLTVRLSSGISANILDFGAPQKHVLKGMMAMEAGREARGGKVQTCIKPEAWRGAVKRQTSRQFR